MTKLSTIISLFCLIGCVHQIYDLTKLYLQFKVRQDVSYDYPSYIELPPIDIMVPMAVAMNLTQLFVAYPDEMNLVCAQMNTNDEGFNYTIDNFQEKCQLYLEQAPIEVSYQLASFIKVKDIKEFSLDLYQELDLHVKPFGVLTDRHCKFIRYYNGLAIFMRIFCLNGTKPFLVNTHSVLLNEGIVNYLTYSFGTYFGIRFSNQTDLPVFEQSKYFIISCESGSFSLFLIRFIKTVMSSLEYPYETNCHHYNKAKSISKCLTEYSLGQLSPYLLRTLIYEWDEHPDHLGFNRNSKGDPSHIISRNNAGDEDDSGLEMQEFNAIANCTKQATAVECEKVSYSVEGENSDQTKNYLGLINIETSWKPNMCLSVHPVLPWDEYVILIGSILGFWFGISIYDRILVILTSITTRFLKIKTQTNRIKKQMNTKLNENQSSIQRESQIKCMRKFPIFDGRRNNIRNKRRSKNIKAEF